ncbi:MAG: hypothetical protein ACKV2Q_27275 [Planctomycetaceae bacterium]
MVTSEIGTNRAWRWTRFSLLAICLHGGCGGGDQDFGPTKSFGPGSGNKSAVAAVKPETPAKTGDSAKDSTSTQAKSELPAEQPATNPETKSVDAKPASETTSSPRSREVDDSTAPEAKPPEKSATSAKTDSPTKNLPTNEDKSQPPQVTATEAETPVITRKPLSPELREWLIAKRRQTSSADGLTVLTAADLSKVSWHDLRSGVLSHEFFGKSGLTTGLVLNPTRRWVIGATDAGWLRLWTIEPSAGWDRFARDEHRAAQLRLGGNDTEQEGVWALAADRQGKWFLSGGADGSLRIGSIEAVAPSENAADEPVNRMIIKLGAKLPAHDGTVTDLEISTDGSWVASGGSDGRVSLWDAKSGTATRSWTDSPGEIADVGLSADGRIVAAACSDKFVRWWSAESPDPPVAAIEKKPATPNQPAVTKPDGNNVAPKPVKPKNGLEHPDLVLSVAVTLDGQFVATGGKDKLVRVWELATGLIVEKHDGAKDAVVEVRFLEGDKRLFIRDRSGLVRIRPRVRRNSDDDDTPPPESERPIQFLTPSAVLNAGREASPVSLESTNGPDASQPLTALRSSASRESRAAARQTILRALAPVADDHEVAKATQIAALEKQLANTTSDSVKADLKKQLSRLKTVAVSQDRTERPKLLGTLTTNFQFISGTASQNRSGPRTVQLTIHGDAELLTATASAAGSEVDDERRKPTDLSASQLSVWDIPTQSLLRHWDDLKSAVGTTAFVESTNQIVSSSSQVFALSTGESQSLSGLTLETISAIATAPDGRHLAVGYAGSVQTTTSVLRLIESATFQELKTHEAFEGLTTAVAFAPDGTSLAVAIRERQLHRLLILDATTLALIAAIEEQPHSTPWLQGLQSETRDRGLTTLRFSSDGRYLLTHGSYGTGDYRLALWQKKGAKWTKESGVAMKASQPIIDDAQPPVPLWFVGGKGSQIAAITSKGLGIVDASNGRLLRSLELKAGLKDRHPVTWSADGAWVAQGDETGQVTLWNLRFDKEAAYFPAQLGPVKALALSADGRVLATLGEENKLHLWNLENWQPKNRVATKPKTAKPATTE